MYMRVCTYMYMYIYVYTHKCRYICMTTINTKHTLAYIIGKCSEDIADPITFPTHKHTMHT